VPTGRGKCSSISCTVSDQVYLFVRPVRVCVASESAFIKAQVLERVVASTSHGRLTKRVDEEIEEDLIAFECNTTHTGLRATPHRAGTFRETGYGSRR
jgi:hypothetical protein